MTRLTDQEPGNDVLASKIGDVMRELRQDDELDEGQTFRAVMTERWQHFDARLKDLEAQQQQMFWLVVATCLGSIAIQLLGAG